MTLTEGDKLGRYEIVSPLGSGGMGDVYLARDERLQRRVAIKVLRANAEQDPVARERLRREALAAAALDHPFICKIFEIGEADVHLFVVMEFVDGDTLHAVLGRGGPLALHLVLDIANELAQALEEAHARGIIDRDLKPANVMLTRQGHIKVMDFGLAKQTAIVSAGSGSEASTRLTDAGTRLGTPAYMSPEQVLGLEVDARSDIFSFGVLLHELATGVHPFLRETPAETMAAILRDSPIISPGTATSPDLRAVIARMLVKACAERLQTVAELRVELEALRERSSHTPTLTTVVASSVMVIERTPFVARGTETEQLRRLLDTMMAGSGGFAVIGGEPGVGKTRLARELLRDAQHRGFLPLVGRCSEMEGAPPFAPFIELIEQAVRLAPQAARIAMGDVAGDIGMMVPSIRRSFSDVPPPPEVPADQQRRLVFDAYLEFLRRGTQKSPVVLLLDDLHWADESSLQLLGHIAPHLSSLRLLVIGTYRDVELDVARPFARTLESLLRQRLATRLSLRRLDESGVQ